MKNENSLGGLFEGILKAIFNIQTRLGRKPRKVEKFDDVREIQRHIKNGDIKLTSEVEVKTSGPASIMLTDTDGNVILIDQHR